jgi:hypothetical protein
VHSNPWSTLERVCPQLLHNPDRHSQPPPTGSYLWTGEASGARKHRNLIVSRHLGAWRIPDGTASAPGSSGEFGFWPDFLNQSARTRHDWISEARGRKPQQNKIEPGGSQGCRVIGALEVIG